MKVGHPLILITLLLGLGCAQIQSPNGGPKDEEGPVVMMEESTQNFQKNFRQKEIKITFDEWVKLKSGGQGILISPQPSRKPRFQVKRKSLIVEFDERDTLLDNTTYLIQLGDEVVDITEENPTDNYIFVFSTGDSIDSLFLDGEVKYLDQSVKPKWENVRAYLYKEWEDTSFVNQTPYYVTKIDSAGHFKFKYLSGGDYRLVVIDDDNKNTAYESGEDRIGFLDRLVHVPSSTRLPAIELYEEWAEFFIDDTDTSKLMRTVLSFTREPGKLNIISDARYTHSWKEQKLTLNHLDTIYPKKFYFEDGSIDYRDSLTIWSTKDKQAVLLNLNVDELRARSKDVRDSFSVIFNQPVRVVDKALLSFTNASSNRSIPIEIETSSDQFDTEVTLQMGNTLDIDSSYGLTIFPAAVEDVLGTSLMDSLDFAFINRASEAGGNLIIKMTNMDSTLHYIVELKSSQRKNQKEVYKYDIFGKGSQDIHIDNLRSGGYYVFITEDFNQDGKWTPGDIDRWLLPEVKYQFAPPDIRNNWDTEFKIDLTDEK